MSLSNQFIVATIIKQPNFNFCFFSDVTAMKGALDVVSNTTGNLKSSASKLGNELKQVKDDLERIKTDCTGQGISKCNNIDTSGLKQEANFTNLPNVDSELSNIRDIMNQNFSGAVDEVWLHSFVYVFYLLYHVITKFPFIAKFENDANSAIIAGARKIFVECMLKCYRIYPTILAVGFLRIC